MGKRGAGVWEVPGSCLRRNDGVGAGTASESAPNSSLPPFRGRLRGGSAQRPCAGGEWMSGQSFAARGWVPACAGMTEWGAGMASESAPNSSLPPFRGETKRGVDAAPLRCPLSG